MLDIYKYTEFHTFLTDAWKEKRARNRSFSMSAWARQLGLENSSPLSLAFKGKRALPKKYLPQIIRTLDLDGNQAQYLEALLDLWSARTPEQKLLYISRLRELAPGETFQGQIVDEFKYLSNPLHGAIIEMTDLKGFKNDPAWIQSRLGVEVSVQEVKEILTRLIQLNLLKQDDSGRLVKTHRHLTTEQDVADLGTQNYHKSISEIAAEAVMKQELSQREFNSYSFNLKPEKMARAKELMRQFVNDFLAECEANPGEGDETVQLNLQLFQITK
ncbi:MAG: TIGR02147 family protein [Bdellovibrionales bacterium]